jgi:hypothetical protein
MIAGTHPTASSSRENHRPAVTGIPSRSANSSVAMLAAVSTRVGSPRPVLQPPRPYGTDGQDAADISTLGRSSSAA